jgi:hypothetical protein
MQNSNQEGVSFGYARRRDPSVTDPKVRYVEVRGRYRPINQAMRYNAGDRVRVLADNHTWFGHHLYKIGRILTVRIEREHPANRNQDNPNRWYYGVDEGMTYVPMEELEPA